MKVGIGVNLVLRRANWGRYDVGSHSGVRVVDHDAFRESRRFCVAELSSIPQEL